MTEIKFKLEVGKIYTLSSKVTVDSTDIYVIEIANISSDGSIVTDRYTGKVVAVSRLNIAREGF